MNGCLCNGLRGDRSGPAIRIGRVRVRGGVGMRSRRRCRCAALLLVLSWVSGCFSPPRRASEMTGNPPTAPATSDGPAQPGEAGPPVDCWKQSGDLEPRVALSKGRRVAVTEFDVEFVDLQFQTPLPRQRMFGPMPISLQPVHLALELIGFGRRYTPLAEEQHQALASQLYDAFVRDLHRRGLELVSQDVLARVPRMSSRARSRRSDRRG